MRVAGLILLICTAASAQPAAFEGTAVNGANGQPLPGVHISLIGVTMSGIRDAYGAISDATGHFSIAGIPPGPYVLLTELRGFIYVQEKKGALPIPAVTLKAGEHVAAFKLEMSPRAVISGRVVDEFGDPVQHVNVHVQAVSPETAPVSLNIAGQDAQTDDRGVFRISGAPGSYHVRANPPHNESDGTPEIRTDGTAPIVYGDTWYPGVTQVEQAAPVEAKAGAEIGGIEIRLARAATRETHRLTISGAVSGLPAGAASTATVRFHYGAGPMAGMSFMSASVRPDGTFTLPFSEPGPYRVWAYYSDAKTHLQSQPVEFRATADVTGLQLNLEPGGEITGSVEVPGDRPGVPREKRTVRIGDSSVETGSDGSFHLTGASPGKYSVEIDPLPQNGYVESMTLDGAKISGGSLDLTHGVRVSKLKIAVTIGGEITGAVLNKDGQRAANSLVVVALAPAEDEYEIDSRSMGRVDDNGVYTFHGVAPGKYRLVALDLFSGSQITSPDDAKRFVQRGELIEVKPGERITKDIKVLEPDDAKK